MSQCDVSATFWGWECAVWVYTLGIRFCELFSSSMTTPICAAGSLRTEWIWDQRTLLQLKITFLGKNFFLLLAFPPRWLELFDSSSFMCQQIVFSSVKNIYCLCRPILPLQLPSLVLCMHSSYRSYYVKCDIRVLLCQYMRASMLQCCWFLQIVYRSSAFPWKKKILRQCRSPLNIVLRSEKYILYNQKKKDVIR